MAIRAFLRMKRACLLEVQEIMSGVLEDKAVYELNTARVLLGDAINYEKRYSELKREQEKRQKDSQKTNSQDSRIAE